MPPSAWPVVHFLAWGGAQLTMVLKEQTMEQAGTQHSSLGQLCIGSASRLQPEAPTLTPRMMDDKP